MNTGKIGSSSSEGSNKFFSSKRRIPILKMLSRHIRRTRKSGPANMRQGSAMQIHMRLMYNMIRLNHSLASLSLEAVL